MFPHFSLRRERSSACLHKFLLLLVLSHSILVLVWSFFGLVLFCMEGGAYIAASLAWMHVCRLSVS